jgi:putative peptidoglycan lipid II flippase
MALESTRGITRGALSFFSGTLLSRITGLIRDLSMAFCFGSHPALAAFMVAYRFANLFRRILGEGPLPSGFVPEFVSLREKDPKQGAIFFRDVFFSLFLLLFAVFFVSEGGLLLLGRSGIFSESSREILKLTALMMPGILFICLYGISSALLQCEKKFFLPSMTPVFFNVVWVITVFLFRDSLPTKAVIALSFAVVFGFFLQWACLLPSLCSYAKKFLSWREIRSFVFFSPEVKAIIKPFLLGVVGTSAVQINSALDAIFARYASLEGPAYLWYAIRIEQLPIALFGVAFASALLPPLSRAFSSGNDFEFKEMLQFAFKRSFGFMFPCTIALFVLASSGVNMLYGRGDFSSEATLETIYCLWGYGLGLLPSIFVLLMAPAFYSQKNFQAPMKGAVYSVIFNVLLNALFVFGFHFGSFSVALATSLAAWLNCFLLIRGLKRRGLWEGGAVLSFYKTGASALLAGGLTLFLSRFLGGDQTIAIFMQQGVDFPRGFSSQFAPFFILSASFVGFFLFFAWILNAEEVLLLKKRVSRRVLSEE